jgi:CheY-like chemotaxis protein
VSVIKPLRVLLVLDSLQDEAVILKSLRRGTYEPNARYAFTEDEFLFWLEEQPQLIICDEQLYAFSGERALQLLRQRGLDIPLILLSKRKEPDPPAWATELGAAACLPARRLGRLDVVVPTLMRRRPARAAPAPVAQPLRRAR